MYSVNCRRTTEIDAFWIEQMWRARVQADQRQDKIVDFHGNKAFLFSNELVKIQKQTTMWNENEITVLYNEYIGFNKRGEM